MVQMVNDLATLTTIPQATLERLFSKCEGVICHSVEENMLAGETITSVNIGIGTLNIKVEEDEIKYKFIPSNHFENAIRETVLTGESPLVLDIEEALKEKIINAYKELF